MSIETLDRGPIKSSYKQWSTEPSFQDLAKFLEKCYNEYTDNSSDMSLPKDFRISYLDQATSFKKTLDYIKRQTS